MADAAASNGEKVEGETWEYEYEIDAYEEVLLKLDLTSCRQIASFTRPPDQPDTIQISKLHTTHPLVYYENKLYQCDWGYPLGTDLFFVANEGLRHHNPLTSQTETSQGSGVASYTLVARPADAREREPQELLSATRLKHDPRSKQQGPNASLHTRQSAFLEQLTTINSIRFDVGSDASGPRPQPKTTQASDR